MKKWFFLLLGVALFATNPTMPEYVDWANQQVVESSRKEAGTIGAAIASFASSGTKSFIDGSTTRENYYLFSIYNTDIFGEKVSTLAILRSFVFLN
jgi:hypothetical protein